MLDLPSGSSLKGYMGSIARKPGMCRDSIRQFIVKLTDEAQRTAQQHAKEPEPAIGRVSSIFHIALVFDGMKIKRTLTFDCNNNSIEGLTDVSAKIAEIVYENGVAADKLSADQPDVGDSWFQVYAVSLGTAAAMPVDHFCTRGLTALEIEQRIQEVSVADTH